MYVSIKKTGRKAETCPNGLLVSIIRFPIYQWMPTNAHVSRAANGCAKPLFVKMIARLKIKGL